ncbi:ubiquinol-cytochrome c reductase iron-sulfur subunit [Nodosilinea sp. E11]|uniref:QcrA and Rieske domain-containing protein n=1 Tax=Nodosilinea sp. E11 TaxID=3037479 RepID=UPI002934E034|nr:Rieske 2Fe-2S domain-containing protein [Nodosilinea sp. E11]WOD41464.1 Rieske 2Fe-2S domain-containing protein [Nodosilinea sp. E11]
MKRRVFINRLGLGLLASSLPVAIAACQSDSSPPAATEGELVAVGTVADLDAAGVLASQNIQGNNLAVIRDPSAPESVIAVSAVCTHSGCTVPWDNAQGLFACPCHGGRFNPDGSVVSGPPQRPLTRFEATIDGEQVLVRL